MKYIQLGTPTQNAYVERFNRFFREDVLDAYLFNDLSEVRKLAWEWMDDYNETHPHKSLGGVSPKKYAEQMNREPIQKSKESELCGSVKDRRVSEPVYISLTEPQSSLKKLLEFGLTKRKMSILWLSDKGEGYSILSIKFYSSPLP